MGKQPQLRLQEKGGKEKLVWLHHEAEEFLTRLRLRPTRHVLDVQEA
jgi:hypothetical protein